MHKTGDPVLGEEASPGEMALERRQSLRKCPGKEGIGGRQYTSKPLSEAPLYGCCCCRLTSDSNFLGI